MSKIEKHKNTKSATVRHTPLHEILVPIAFAQMSCDDPESFARGCPTLSVSFYDRREDLNSTKSGPSSARQRNAIGIAL